MALQVLPFLPCITTSSRLLELILVNHNIFGKISTRKQPIHIFWWITTALHHLFLNTLLFIFISDHTRNLKPYYSPNFFVIRITHTSVLLQTTNKILSLLLLLDYSASGFGNHLFIIKWQLTSKTFWQLPVFSGEGNRPSEVSSSTRGGDEATGPPGERRTAYRQSQSVRDFTAARAFLRASARVPYYQQHRPRTLLYTSNISNITKIV